MKILKWSLLLLLFPLMTACFSDQSTDATRPLSLITIESGIDTEYNMGKNEELVIEPVITQSNKEKPLSYTWEVNLQPYSHDRILNFKAEALGKYNCRLIVENEDGKSFFIFTIYVNSPYEEGITVISKDSDGNSMLSFMQKPATGEKGVFYQGDCFALNNSDTPFAANVADIVQSNRNLIVACQGGGENNDQPTLYFLNEKTLVVENMFTVPLTEYADFKPTKLGVPATTHQGTSYPVLCENGKVYDFSPSETIVSLPRKLQSTYAQSCIVYSDGNYNDILHWDNENNGLSLLYNSNHFYCSSKYHLRLSDDDFATENFFNGRRFVTMVKINMTPQQRSIVNNRQEFLIITKVGNTSVMRRDLLYTDIWGYDFDNNVQTFDVSSTAQKTVKGMPLSEQTPCIANKTYFSLLFADGNKVRSWKYESSIETIVNAPTLLTVGSDNAVITAFEISEDNTKTYVAFYEPDVEGLNGSVWVFNTDTGEILEQHNNICYKPIKIFYKVK